MKLQCWINKTVDCYNGLFAVINKHKILDDHHDDYDLSGNTFKFPCYSSDNIIAFYPILVVLHHLECFYVFVTMVMYGD